MCLAMWLCWSQLYGSACSVTNIICLVLAIWSHHPMCAFFSDCHQITINDWKDVWLNTECLYRELSTHFWGRSFCLRAIQNQSCDVVMRVKSSSQQFLLIMDECSEFVCTQKRQPAVEQPQLAWGFFSQCRSRAQRKTLVPEVESVFRRAYVAPSEPNRPYAQLLINVLSFSPLAVP